MKYAVESPITNCWKKVKAKKISVEHINVFTGKEGYAYSHHAQLTSINGKLIATWSCGFKNEDDPGQKMVMSTSDDKGDTWSDAFPVVDCKPGKYADAIITSMGIRKFNNKLIAYYGSYEYSDKALIKDSSPPERIPIGKRLWPADEDFWSFGEKAEIIVSDNLGATWSEPVGCIEGFIPNMPPAELKSGRLIIPGHLLFPYTDDAEGISGWKKTGIYGLSEDFIDGPGRFQRELKRRGLSHGFCEASFYQTDDEVIHMMLRTAKEAGLLAVTESYDDGETWSDPVYTGFSDCGNRFHFGRLPDGRFIAVSCPEYMSPRTPLVVQISNDGTIFDKHFIIGEEQIRKPRMPGNMKGGRYGYPVYHIMEDNMYVIYSTCKEDINICRFCLSSLC